MKSLFIPCLLLVFNIQSIFVLNWNKLEVKNSTDIFSQKSIEKNKESEKIVEQDTINPLNIEMVYVSGGDFNMGCTSEQGDKCFDDEKPSQKVKVSSFYIGKYEVTQAQWQEVMGDNPSSYGVCLECPVEWVSYYDVEKFLIKLNQKTGKKYRLPTEAEWEYAARGGNESKGYKYSGTNSIDKMQISNGKIIFKTYPVGQKKPNELGIYDMSGNVWEWCSDWFGEYSGNSLNNPKGPNSGVFGVARGGCSYDSSWCRISQRSSRKPEKRFIDTGLRVVLNSSQ